MLDNTIYAKIKGTLLGVGVEIKGEKGVLLSSKTDREEIKKDFEKKYPECNIVWEE